MSKRFSNVFTTMKRWLFPQEDESFFQRKDQQGSKDIYNVRQVHKYNDEPRIIHQYPQKDEEVNPLVKKGVVRLPERKERLHKQDIDSFERKRLKIEQKIKKEERKVNKKESNVEQEREFFTGKMFSARETPSPVYGYRKKTERVRNVKDNNKDVLEKRNDSDLERMRKEQLEHEKHEEQKKKDIDLKNYIIGNNQEVDPLPEQENKGLESDSEIMVPKEDHNQLTRSERRRKFREERKKEKRHVTSRQEEINKISRKQDEKEKHSKGNIDSLPFNVLMYQGNKKSEVTKDNTYAFPSIQLLNVPKRSRSLDDDEWISTQVNTLNDTFDYFGIRAKVVHVTKGPSVTRFEVHPEPGVKVSKITNLTDDLKLSLAAKEIRMEAPIPGKNTIGIEVPNKVSEPVFLREVLQHEAFQTASSPLTVALGKDISGEPIVTDLQKMPHGLIAGATGSGKSVCVNSIILSLVYKASPDEVRLLLIDPKMVELAPYNGLPHLATPVITDSKEATEGLKWAVAEMERRYELFAAKGARDLKRYNEKMKDLNKEKEQLPYLVIIVDELSDLMMVSPHDVEEAICRIAQKARACGIHLLVATQRPSVDVITGLIKANIPTRVAFSVSSQADSRTIIDSGGAEKLLGKGDMLFLENGSSKSLRIQGTFVTDEEIDRVMDKVRCKEDQQFLFEKEALQLNVENETEDELFETACQFVSEQQTASVSLLQRHFRIGYNRAARLIDEMANKGIISESKGSKPRDVFFTKEEMNEKIGFSKET